MPPPDPPFYTIHHTILVMAISCEGRAVALARGMRRTPREIRVKVNLSESDKVCASCLWVSGLGLGFRVRVRVRGSGFRVQGSG